VAATPEAKVKKTVRAFLDDLIARGAPLYYHQPVMNGMGKPSLDFIGCANEKYFAIETKPPGGSPTERQHGTIEQIHRAKGRVLVFDGRNEKQLWAWMAALLRS
jgi:hypothetical protein